MNKFYKRLTLPVLIILLTMPLLYANVFSADNVYLRQSMSVFNVIQATYDYSFSMTVENSGNQTYSGISAEVGKLKGFDNPQFIPGAETVGPRESRTYFFKIDIPRQTDPGLYFLPITFYYNNNGAKAELVAGSAAFSVARHISSVAGYDAALLDMAYTLENSAGFTANLVNTLSIAVTNRGNNLIQDVKVSLSLPEGMTLNNSMGTQNIGALGIGEEKTARFPILLDKKIENKNHPITVIMTGTSRNGSANAQQTIYIPVSGGEETEEDSTTDIEISDISAAAQITAGDDVMLSFSVKNTGNQEAENVKIEVVPDAGLANKSKNIFIEQKMAPGEKNAYYVQFLSDKNTERKSVSIRITVTAGVNEKAITQSQYASVYIEKSITEDEISIKTPQLIVDDYSFGGSSVSAGSEFGLNIVLRNTSAKSINNIKITLNADGGAFIPVGSSNSLYIGEIGAGERISRSINMSASPTADERTTAITVSMIYEDNDGGQFNASDMISIPVIQVTKLTVDDILGPPELYVGVQTGIDVRFYNTGKTILQNLRVMAEGNFDLMDSSAYYAGNMNSGASDSASFAFMPSEPGELKGKVIFTYDDPSGNPQQMEKEFSFNVMSGFADQVMDFPMEIPQQPSYVKYYIGGGILAALIIGLIILWRVLKRRKMHKDMEIDF